ncbi:radical SAM/SPASM domain-containing protein [Nosocomiicoccus ampullae]|uniref:radical SAM/SPASM domain-containing protein n=1 Tax=Nosocomiicoccus ampullae TaxID=489910 RepID=UPI00254A7C0B|nr:radical SAM protein [Nosocomiicoccus ampullae]MDK6862983.1 radical SAM protein [Nosocomiicoccus ampullae]
MKLVKNLIHTKENENYLLYCPDYNKAVIVDEELYECINNKTDLIDVNSIEKDDLEKLIRNGILYENIEVYNQGIFDKILKNRDTSVTIDTVYFHATQRCNLRCTYCYNMENLNKPDQLTTEECKNILYKLSKIGTKHINFTGGEILLRKDIIELCKFTNSLNMTCDILSNGMLLNKRLELLNYVNHFVISLDTLRDENNLRLGLNIRKLIKNLESVPNEYRHKFLIRSVAVSDNEDWKEVEVFVKEKLGMDYIVVPFIPNNIGEDLKHIPDLKCFPINKQDCSTSGAICGASFKIIAIDSDGSVYPCQTMIQEEYKITNVKEENWFNELKESSITNKFQNRAVYNIKGCDTCSIRHLCGGGCSAISYNLFGDIGVSNKVMCDLQKRIAENKLRNILKNYG